MWNDMKLRKYDDDQLLAHIEGKKVVLYGASSRIQKYLDGFLKDRVAYIVDSNDARDGERIGNLSIHTLQYLEEETNKEDIIVLTVLKCISLIEYNLNRIGVKEWYYEQYRGIGAHKVFDLYIRYKENHVFDRINEKILNENCSYKFIDFIYDGKFVDNVYRIIKRYSDEDEHLVVVHCLDYLNENDSNHVWNHYLEKNNILIIDDIYHEIPEQIQNFITEKMNSAQKIIFHSGLFSKRMTDCLRKTVAANSYKSCCILHGAEMQYTPTSEFYSEIVQECGKVYLGSKQRNPFSVYTLNQEQVEYINIDYSDSLAVPQEGKKHDEINILLGFSATQLCDHAYAISLLEKYKEQKIKVYCPLNYSVENQNYVQDVIEYGRQKLQDSFVPITEFMELSEYEEFLSSIDIALFPNKKQCGWTTLAALYQAGKKIYCSDIMMKVVKERGITAYPLEQICQDSFSQFCRKEYGYDKIIWKSAWSDIYTVG